MDGTLEQFIIDDILNALSHWSGSASIDGSEEQNVVPKELQNCITFGRDTDVLAKTADSVSSSGNCETIPNMQSPAFGNKHL